MSEETNFWGVAMRGYANVGHPASALLPGWRLVAPTNKPIPVYPVFSSKESASAFVEEHGEHLGLVRGPQEKSLLENLLEDIRPIERSEIPPEHYVLSDRRGLVKWSELFSAS